MIVNYNTHTIILRVRKEVKLPEHPYALFHGIFGRLLFRYNNENAKAEHDDCDNDCLYCTLFKYSLAANHKWHGKYTNPPQGFVLRLANNNKRHYLQGDFLMLELILVGDHQSKLNAIVDVLRQIETADLSLWTGCFSFVATDRYTDIESLETKEKEHHTVTLELITPLILESKGELVEHPKASDIFNSLYERFTLFNQIYCKAPYHPIDRLIVNNMQMCSDLRLVKWKRRDLHSRKAIVMTGVLGRISLEGVFDEDLMKMLVIGQDLHMGRYASYGLGQYVIK